MFKSIRILGVRITPMTIPEMHAAIGTAIETKTRLVILSQNLHSVYLVHRLPQLQAMQETATYMRIDGMPLVWFARLLGHDVKRSHRTGWMDWIESFMAEADRVGRRIFYVGSTPHVKEKALGILNRKFPNVELVGHHGYFDVTSGSEENVEVLTMIANFQPDLVLVGMGMPRQEAWLLDNKDAINAPVLLTCGACMDYVAGEQPTPPRWMGQLGLEWLHRLAADPKRMWFRYLVEPWFAVRLFLGELVRGRGRGTADDG